MAPTGSAVPCQGLVPSGALAAMLCLLPVDANAGRLYQWTDEDGNVHYGDRMPAEASNDAHRVLNEDGTLVVEKASSEAEREQRLQDEAEEAEERERAEHERRTAEERRKRDRVILQTFTTERDIEMTRANRVEAVQVQINIAEHGIRQLESRRAETLQRLEKLPEDAPATKTNRERLAEIDARLQQRQANRTRLVTERAEVAERFDHYLERFRELNQ